MWISPTLMAARIFWCASMLLPTALGRSLTVHTFLPAPATMLFVSQPRLSMVERDRRGAGRGVGGFQLHNRRGLGRSRGRTVSTSSQPLPDATRYHVYLEKGGRPQEYVSRVLIMVASLSESDASSITSQASRFGLAMVGTFEKSLAEHTYTGMRRAGLTASLKPADDGPMLFGSGHAGEELWP